MFKEQPRGSPGSLGGPALGLGEQLPQRLQPTLRQVLHGILLHETLGECHNRGGVTTAAVDNPARRGAGVNRDTVESACSELCSGAGTEPSPSGDGLGGQMPTKPVAAKTKGPARTPPPLLLSRHPWDYIGESIGQNCRARKRAREDGDSRLFNVNLVIPVPRRSCLSCRIGCVGLGDEWH